MSHRKWRILSQSGDIQTIKDKLGKLEKDYDRIQNPQLIENNKPRMLIKNGVGVDTIPASLVGWEKRIRMGESPLEIIKRVKLILALFSVTN